MWYVVSYECFYPVRSRLTSFYGGGGGGGGGGGAAHWSYVTNVLPPLEYPTSDRHA